MDDPKHRQPSWNFPHGAERNLRAYIVDRWFPEGGLGAPIFLWERRIEDEARIRAKGLRPGGLMPRDVAFAIVVEPMRWYYQTVSGIDMTRDDGRDMADPGTLPTFTVDGGALAGASAVAGNAMMSSDYLPALDNLTMLVEQTAEFLEHVPDREREGEDAIDGFISQVRVYMDVVALGADADVGERALGAVTRMASVGSLRRRPLQLIGMLSACLPFARWDDTRVLAYGALEQALSAIRAEDFGDDIAMNHLLIDFLRHDLLRMAGDDEAADAFLRDHLHQGPCAESYAAELFAAGRYGELLDLIRTVCAHDEHPDFHECIMLPDELMEYGWGTFLEATYQAMGDVKELDALYDLRVRRSLASRMRDVDDPDADDPDLSDA